jgi:hypothetical protein
MHGEVGDVDLVADLPETQIAGDRAVRARDQGVLNERRSISSTSSRSSSVIGASARSAVMPCAAP